MNRDQNPNANRVNASVQGFPLGALFLLVALISLVLAMIGWMTQGEDIGGEFSLMAVTGIGAFAGFLVGIIVGLYHFNRFRGMAIGLFSGTIFGALTGPLCLAGWNDPWSSAIASLAGAGILIGLAVLYRWLNGDDPVSVKADFSKFTRSPRQ